MNRKESIPPRWKNSRLLVAVVALALLVTPLFGLDRTALKPGWNMFSAQQDIEIGQQVSQDAEQQLPMLNNSRVDNYVNSLGQRLASRAPGNQYPYHFQVVNDQAINAFALPGGPVFINRGVIESADSEDQLAGVIAHEISHVALRHGTNQASKASAAQMPLAILGGLLGNDSTASVLAQLGANFAVSSILLKYSRSAETQADVMGTQILYDSGYDPRAMGQFFQKIEAQQQGGGQVEFFSNHPSPDNRIERVGEEVDALGGNRRSSDSKAREFNDIKRYLQSLPVASGKNLTGDQTGSPELLIVSAKYGAQDRFIDVRQRLQSQVQNGRLDLQVNNSSMGGDPISRSKTLQIRYQWANQAYDVTVQEGQRISIPTSQQITDNERRDSSTAPERSSNRFEAAENRLLRIEHPDNWQAYGQGDAMTIAPKGGMVEDGNGNQAMAYGVIVNIYEPNQDSYRAQLQGPGYEPDTRQDSLAALKASTDRLVQEFRLSNRNMRVSRYGELIRNVSGEPALSTYLSNDSPLGGRESNWLVTIQRPEGLLFLVFTAPDRDFQNYEGTFRQMLYSVRIINR